jgi:hypothetical protein
LLPRGSDPPLRLGARLRSDPRLRLRARLRLGARLRRIMRLVVLGAPLRRLQGGARRVLNACNAFPLTCASLSCSATVVIVGRAVRLRQLLDAPEDCWTLRDCGNSETPGPFCPFLSEVSSLTEPSVVSASCSTTLFAIAIFDYPCGKGELRLRANY